MTRATKTPQTWTADAYIRPIDRAHEGMRALTHLAALRQPDGTECRGYVKHFPAEFHRGLFNEWFGYTVLHSLGVPQPQAALMPAPVLSMPGNPVAWAFVSCQPTPRFEGTPTQIYNVRNPEQYRALVTRLFACPALPLLIACDQILKNSDRNLGNLVFTGKSNFVAIDHSDILGGPAWRTSETHFAQSWTTSKLIENFVTLQSLKPSLCNAIMASAELVSAAYFEAHADLAQALDARAKIDHGAALDMVWWRTISLRDWFAEKLNLIA